MAIQHILDSDENFSSLSQKEQVRRIAYAFYVQTNNSEFSPKDLGEIFTTNNLAVPNIPRELSSLVRDRGRVIFKSKGKYVLERSFIKSMAEQFGNTYSKEISPQFHEIIDRVSQDRHKEYLREALTCFQCKLYRPAIIMTWIVVIDMLYDYVINNHLRDFNDVLKNVNKKLVIKSKSDFEELRESDFILYLKTAAIISKEQRKVLDEKLTIRNSAAHPNGTSFKEAKTATFIEELFSDVLDKITK